MPRTPKDETTSLIQLASGEYGLKYRRSQRQRFARFLPFLLPR